MTAVADYSKPNKFTDPEAWEAYEANPESSAWINLLDTYHPIRRLLRKKSELEEMIAEVDAGHPLPGISVDDPWWETEAAREWVLHLIATAPAPAHLRNLLRRVKYMHTPVIEDEPLIEDIRP